MVMGTVGYMSPEQAKGQPVDYHADQFAFGAILYEMATGKRAFQRDTAVETLSAIIKEEPDSLSDLQPDLPAHLQVMVERCLSKVPEDRYESTSGLGARSEEYWRIPRRFRGNAPSVASSSGVVSVLAVITGGGPCGLCGWLGARRNWNLSTPSRCCLSTTSLVTRSKSTSPME